MGGRGGSSGFSGSAKSYFDNMSTSGPNKYSFVQQVASGSRYPLDTAVSRVAEGRQLTDAQRENLRGVVQEEARKWLADNPKPRNPRKEGYTWNGKKYVRS